MDKKAALPSGRPFCLMQVPFHIIDPLVLNLHSGECGATYKKMLQIGNIKIYSPFFLAPLAGYTDLPFRLLCREYGAGMCVSEMISCHGLVYGQQKTIDMLASVPEERPVAFQLFGSDPEIMGKASAILSQFNPDSIDINMGCPVPKVTKRGAGAALMRYPLLAGKIIERVRQHSSMPITVKIRSGLDSSNITAVSFARMAESAGASAIFIHGRTWAQGFAGRADRQIIAQIKEAVSVPVIGNGDIQSYQDGISIMKQTGCDGVMIGRGALGNPWIFKEYGKPEDIPALMQGVYRHLELIERYLHPTDRQLGSIKNQIGRYFTLIPGSSNIRKLIYGSSSYVELKENLDTLKARI
jgi:tRNA-dihydrouridine synthase B